MNMYKQTCISVCVYVCLPSSTRALHGGDRKLMSFLSIKWEITKGNFIPKHSKPPVQLWLPSPCSQHEGALRHVHWQSVGKHFWHFRVCKSHPMHHASFVLIVYKREQGQGDRGGQKVKKRTGGDGREGRLSNGSGVVCSGRA